MRQTATQQKWYGSQRWRNRARHQLRLHPLCVMCLAQDQVVPATVADHIIPHKGNERLFWEGELQSLCATHHSASKQQAEKHGFYNDIGPDGWPLDPRHPVYQT